MLKRNVFIIAGIILLFTAIKIATAVPSSPAIVTINGYQLIVQKRNPDNSLSAPEPYIMRGVGWSPAGIGDSIGSQFASWYTTDIPLITQINANTVRTWAPFPTDATGIAILDSLYEENIMVVMTVDITGDYSNQVNYFKNHPAVLMWLLGNEWNYNQFYTYNGDNNWCISEINTAVDTIHSLDPNHPVATCYGGLPSSSTLSACSKPDLWGLNVYNGISFGSLFSDWQSISSKPMFLTEYGADAYNKNIPGIDEVSQDTAVKSLWNEIEANLSAQDTSKVCVGGNIFEFNDEWWKSGNPSSHDTGGFNVLVYPDNFANEEWWGIVDIYRNKRKLFYTLSKIWPDKNITFSFSKSMPVSSGILDIHITTAFPVINQKLYLVNPSNVTNSLTLTGSISNFYSTLDISASYVNGEYFFYFTCETNSVLLDAYYVFNIDTVPPETPVLNYVYYGSDKAIIDWEKSKDNLSGIKTYKIYRSTDNINYSLLATNSSTEFNDATIKDNTMYYYKISAVDKANNESYLSKEKFLKTTENKSFSYPNPCNINNNNLKILINLNLDESVSIQIYDIYGNQLKEILKKSNIGLGAKYYEWDGTDKFGQKVKSGLYYVVVTFGGNRKDIRNIIIVNE